MTTEWLEWRRGGIGASDVAALVGLSPWASPFSVWTDKVGLRADNEPSSMMEFGKRFEPVGVAWFSDKRPGLYVAGEQTWCTHRDYEWARCTVDGFVFETEHADDVFAHDIDAALGAYEGKVDFHGSAAAWAEQIPPHYQAQAQWQCFVCDLERVWFGVLHPFGRYEVYELQRDEADIALLHKAAEAFWHEHVLTGIAPPTDGTDATTEALADAWDDPEGKVEVDPSLVLAYRAASDALKVAEDAKKAAGNALRAAIGERADATVDGKLAASWRPQTAERIDADALRTAHPEIAKQVTKTTESRVLRLH